MYGPYYPLHSSKYMKIRAIPKLASERTEMFRFFSCKFRIEKYKENCARIAIWRDFEVSNCFTIEASALGFLNRDRETIHFNTGLLQEFGECLVHSLFEFTLIQEEDRKMKIALAKKLKEQRKTKRLTIAEILGGNRQLSIKKPVLSPSNAAVGEEEEQPELNPNEPNDEPQQAVEPVQQRPMPQPGPFVHADDTSSDSNAFLDSSSSEGTPLRPIQKTKTGLDARYFDSSSTDKLAEIL